MCDCSHHTGGKAPETFPTGQSTARWGAHIWGTLHDRLNASSNYDAAAAPGPPTPREGGWAFRWLCCRYVRPSAPLMFPGTIEQTGRKCYRSRPTRARRPVGATSTQAGLVLERSVSIHPFPPGRRRLDLGGLRHSHFSYLPHGRPGRLPLHHPGSSAGTLGCPGGVLQRALPPGGGSRARLVRRRQSRCLRAAHGRAPDGDQGGPWRREG